MEKSISLHHPNTLPSLPEIHVLSLVNRTDRRDHLMAEFKKQRISQYEFWAGKVGTPAFMAISQSHKMIVADAKRKNEPFRVIAEDDVIFSDMGAYQYFIDRMPTDMDFDLYLSGIYWGEIKPDGTVYDFSSLTLYVINQRYYDLFLATPQTVHIDRGQAGRGKFVVCNPFICHQIDGFSDNVGHVTNYNKEYLYGRKFYRSVAANKALIAISS